MANFSTSSISKLRTKLKIPIESSAKERYRIDFDQKEFIKAAKELQKTLQPEDILIDATDKITKSN